jgi:hypothetical protein
MHHQVLAIDDGHGAVKLAYRDPRGQLCKRSFRSIAVPHVDSAIAVSTRRVQAGLSVMTVEVDTTKFDVDLDETAIPASLLVERNETNDFPWFCRSKAREEKVIDMRSTAYVASS